MFDIDIAGGTDTFVFMLIAVVAALLLVVTFLIGEVFDFAGDFDFDLDDAGAGVLNLQTIAAFLAGFGAIAWLLSAYYDVGSLPAAAGGLAGGLPVAGVVVVMTRYFMKQAATTSHSLTELVGEQALVTLAIPATGVGRIQYERRGSTHTVLARSGNATAIASGSVVIVQSVVAGECIVTPSA